MDIKIFIIATLISAYVFAAFTETVAKEKGYSPSNWFWGGFFFGPIALLAAVGLPTKFDKSKSN